MKHFLYTAWPDHGVPQYSVSIHRFISQHVRPVYKDSSAPLIVHCRWGEGRGGEGRGGREGGEGEEEREERKRKKDGKHINCCIHITMDSCTDKHEVHTIYF